MWTRLACRPSCTRFRSHDGAVVSGIDLEVLTSPISESEPCGPNLEYDPAFAEMEKAAQGTAEQQYGDTIIEAVPPDWDTVRRTALDLSSRTKDLRVLIYLTRAALATHGFSGFRDGLGLLKRWLARYWQTLHPQLDPEDDNDPTLRNNTLGQLADLRATIQLLQTTPLVKSRAFGAVSRRDVAQARREMPMAEGQQPPSAETIDAAFQDCDLKELVARSAAVNEAFDFVRGIDVAIGDEIGEGNGPNLQNLKKELDSIRKVYTEQLNKRGYDPNAPDPAAAPAEAAPAATAPAATAVAASSSVAAPRLTGEFTCREEAIRAIDAVCVWFEKYEPSSPLPLLLRRAKRLSTKSFLEILRDISPGGVGEAEALGGLGGMLAGIAGRSEPAEAEPEPSSEPPRRKPRDPDAY